MYTLLTNMVKTVQSPTLQELSHTSSGAGGLRPDVPSTAGSKAGGEKQPSLLALAKALKHKLRWQKKAAFDGLPEHLKVS